MSFYLIRQAAISEPHDPVFNHLMFLHALEEIATIGAALSDSAYKHIEQLVSFEERVNTPMREKAR